MSFGTGDDQPNYSIVKDGDEDALFTGYDDEGPLQADKERYLTRLVTRTRRVPYTRKVKVPVKGVGIYEAKKTIQVEVEGETQVPVIRQMEQKVVEVKEVKENVRKRVWVEKEVDVEVTKQVEVEKLQTVQVRVPETKPITVVKSKDFMVEEQLEFRGYRIDEIEQFKVVEEEEELKYERIPRLIGRSGPDEAVERILREIETEIVNRREGLEIYFEGDPELVGLELDDSLGTPLPRVVLHPDREFEDIPQWLRDQAVRTVLGFATVTQVVGVVPRPKRLPPGPPAPLPSPKRPRVAPPADGFPWLGESELRGWDFYPWADSATDLHDDTPQESRCGGNLVELAAEADSRTPRSVAFTTSGWMKKKISSPDKFIRAGWAKSEKDGLYVRRPGF